MDKLQYDSFYKFLVSLGMLLITLPVLAFLYVLNMDCKLISQSDYDNLSQISIKRIGIINLLFYICVLKKLIINNSLTNK